MISPNTVKKTLLIL